MENTRVIPTEEPPRVVSADDFFWTLIERDVEGSSIEGDQIGTWRTGRWLTCMAWTSGGSCRFGEMLGRLRLKKQRERGGDVA
jgi:hypothetical protein